MPGGPVGGHPSRSCGSVALLYLGSSASILDRFGYITQVATLDFIIAYWLSTWLRIVQLSELRGALAGSTQPTNCTILGIPEGRLPSRMLGSARRLEKQRTYRRTGSGDQEDTSPEHLTLYFPKIPLKKTQSRLPFLFISSLLTHKPLIRHFPRFLQALPNH